MGSSKKQTVGYRYYLGEHLIFTHGPVDKLSRITFDGSRVAWSGAMEAEGSGSIFAPTLFGGEDIGREGGVKGNFDFCPGEPTQPVNTYLQARLGGDIPAFRGVSGLVFKQMYLGTSAYLKKVSARLTRIHKTTDGAEQWYDEKAEVATGGVITLTSLWEWQSGGATTTPPADPAAFPVPATGWQPAAPAPFGVNNTGGVYTPPAATPWAPHTALWIRRNLTLIGPTPDLQIFVSAENAAWLYFDGVYIGAQNPTNVQGGDGSATFDIPEELATKGTHTIAIYALDEGSTIPANSDTYIYAESLGIDVSGDMNPAHIIRECLTDNLWGMGYNAADVDDTAFMAAADQLYDEGMGISIVWDQQMPIEQFIGEIIKHIDASLYVDRRTGKFVLKLIRGDYDIDTIPSFDESNIDKVEGFQRPTIGELTNSVTVTYWDAATGQKATITRDDPALILTQEATIDTTLQYPGFTNLTIADRIAKRDLKTLSNPLASCTIYADSDAEDLNIGSVFKFSWAEYGIVNMPMRVTAIAFGDGISNKVKMSVAQDVFTLPEAGIIQPPDTGWEDPNQPPEASEFQLAFELPYVELLQQLGLSTVESTLASTPEVGYAGIAISRPSGGSINARMMIDAGAGYEEVGLIDFCPTAVLDENIDQVQTTFAITDGIDLATAIDLGAVGSWCQIDDELMIVVALDDDSIEVERGTLDTTPAPHTSGSPIFFWDNFAQNDDEQYVATDTVNIKALTITGDGELDISVAPANALEIVGRAVKPYAPGNLVVELDTGNEVYPTDVSGEFNLTWSHRNRVTQGDTLVPTTDGDITPEVGTTYTVRTFLGGVLQDEYTGITDNFKDDIGMLSDGDGRVEVWAVRDTIYSYQALWCEFDYLAALPDDVIASFILTKLRHFYAMSETSGTVLKDQHRGADLTLINTGNITYNGTTIKAGGTYGAMRFTSTGGAQINGVPYWQWAQDNFAVFGWLKFDNATETTQRAINCNAESSDASEAINITCRCTIGSTAGGNSGKPEWFWEHNAGTDNNVQQTGATAVTTSAHSFVMQRDAALLNVQYWRDAVLDNTLSYTNQPTGGNSASNKFTVGNTQDNNMPIRAYMQDMMFFNSPLTKSEIEFLHNAGAGRTYQELLDIANDPMFGLWTPAALNGKVVWMISDDADNTVVSGKATVLANRSGLGGALIHTGNGAKHGTNTLNGRPVLTADGTDTGEYVFNQTVSATQSMTGITLVAVHRMAVADVSAGLKVLVGVNRSSSGIRADLSNSDVTANSIRLGGRITDGGTYTSVNDGVNNGTNWCLTVGVRDYSSGNQTLYNNGTQTATAATAGTGTSSATNSTDGINIGRYSGGNPHQKYMLAEVLVIRAALGSTDREKLEGYLAHKWGLTAGLPGGHPYKSSPPTI